MVKTEYSVCRICFCKIEEDYLELILVYQEKLLYVAGVNLLEDQSHYICNHCVKELEISYNFKKKCEQAEKLLVEEKIKIDTEIKENVEAIPIEIVEEEFEEDEPDNISLSELVDPSENQDLSVAKSKKARKAARARNIECEMCDKKYLHFDSLKVHYRREHKNKKSYSCDRCQRQFFIRKQLEDHKSQCPKLANDPSKPLPINEPAKIDGESLSFCCHCGKTMGTRYLSKHIHDIHTVRKDEIPDLICDLCGEKYKTRNGILDHMRRRHLFSEYQCHFCREIFTSYGIRRNHEIHFHTFKYKYECQICSHKFIVNRDFRKHMITHTGEKNYLCTICGKRLSRKSVLDLHMATHTDIRPFSCNTCTASFKTRKALRVHQNVHEERKYECPVCQQRFLVNQACRQHVIKRHPDYKLPPPGTIVNKKALKRIEEISAKYSVKLNNAQHSLTQGQTEEKIEEDSIRARSLIHSSFQKQVELKTEQQDQSLNISFMSGELKKSYES